PQDDPTTQAPAPPSAPGAPVAQWPTGTVTFLFTSIVGSIRLWEQYPATMPQVLSRHDALVREAVAACGGVVFRTIDDAFCAAFASASAALGAALAIQRALHDASWRPGILLRVRIALHTDTVEVRDRTGDPTGRDYFGLPLSRVARLLAAAHGGQ